MFRCVFAALAVAACAGDPGKDTTGETGTPGDTDTDADSDSDADSDTDTTVDTSATWATDVAPIIESKCASCHFQPPGAPSGGLEIVDHTSIVNVASTQVPSMPYITPGDPDTSYLWHKLDGTHLDVGGSMSAMPLSARLPDDQLATIQGWILGGAKP